MRLDTQTPTYLCVTIVWDILHSDMQCRLIAQEQRAEPQGSCVQQAAVHPGTCGSAPCGAHTTKSPKAHFSKHAS